MITPIRIFISSVQNEFAEERRLLCQYIRQDALFGRFFEPFIFEELPAINLSAPEAYLTEAAQSDIYLGLYGRDYGYEDAEGVSPTEREYDAATKANRHRIIFIKRCGERHPKEQTFIHKVEQDVVRKSFTDYDELRIDVYASLVRYLEEKEYLRFTPWDATFHPFATLEDIDDKKIESFVSLARKKRGFKLQYLDNNKLEILIALNLASASGRITNAAILLFGKNPQSFFITSQVKCMVFPTEIMTKPILSLKVFQGTLFEMVDAAKGFVMQHLDARIGTRHESNSVDVEYEIPMEAVAEMIINACVHRSYVSNGSVQVMLFRDRLEVWNPGSLPYGMTVDKLKTLHSSVPVNPILAAPAFLAGYIEHSGTGTTDIINYCLNAGLAAPEFIQDEDFRVVIRRKNAGLGSVVNMTDDQININNESPNGRHSVTPNVTPSVTPNVTPERTLIRIKDELAMIIGNKYLTADEIAAHFGVSVRTIRRDFNTLRESYRIEWITLTPTTGYWEIEKLKG